jgi:hypothetical protein
MAAPMGGASHVANGSLELDLMLMTSPSVQSQLLELWVRDSEHKSHVSGRVLEPCSGDVVIDVAVDDGQCLA